MPTPEEWDGNYEVYRATVQEWGVPKKMAPPPPLGSALFRGLVLM